MGLDFLDIKFRIDKALNVSLTDEDFMGIFRDGDVTAGDLFSLIVGNSEMHATVRHDLHLNFRLWQAIQSALVTATPLPAGAIALNTPLAELFPRDVRRMRWETFSKACSYRIVELEYPRYVRIAGFSLALAMVFIEQLQWWQIPGAIWLWPVLGIFGLWMLMATYTQVLPLFEPLRLRFPGDIATVKQLCRAIRGANVAELAGDGLLRVEPNHLDIWQKLTTILADVLDVDARNISLDSRLKRDLGAE